jgi:hypothetical protein
VRTVDEVVESVEPDYLIPVRIMPEATGRRDRRSNVGGACRLVPHIGAGQ